MLVYKWLLFQAGVKINTSRADVTLDHNIKSGALDVLSTKKKNYRVANKQKRI